MQLFRWQQTAFVRVRNKLLFDDNGNNLNTLLKTLTMYSVFWDWVVYSLSVLSSETCFVGFVHLFRSRGWIPMTHAFIFYIFITCTVVRFNPKFHMHVCLLSFCMKPLPAVCEDLHACSSGEFDAFVYE